MSRAPFIVYVDESGDPGMGNFDPSSPVFVLCAALYRTEDYLTKDLPELSRVKFEYWWHDAVIFHSHKIRNKIHPFQAMADKTKTDAFMQSIGQFFAKSTTTIIAAAIDKAAHKKQYHSPVHPYDLAMQFCLERVYLHIHDYLKINEEVTFVFEKRGKKEDAALEEKFNYYKGSTCNACRKNLPFRICFADKKENIAGLQIADLAAYPISRYIETKNAARKDWLCIEPRIRKSSAGKIDGWGLKVFP